MDVGGRATQGAVAEVARSPGEGLTRSLTPSLLHFLTLSLSRLRTRLSLKLRLI